MENASRARVLRLVVHPLTQCYGCSLAPGIKQMEQGRRRFPIRIDAHDAVPKRIAGDGDGLDVGVPELNARGRERLYAKGHQAVGIDLHASVRRVVESVWQLGAEAIYRLAARIEQQRAHRRGSSVESEDSGSGGRQVLFIARCVAR